MQRGTIDKREVGPCKLSVVDMSKDKSELPYGTLDLLVLKTLESMGSLHGYAIARRIEQVAGESLQLSQGSIYPALIRLEQERWVTADWGLSETNRKVKFYSLTRAGRKQLAIEVEKWEKAKAFVARFLEPPHDRSTRVCKTTRLVLQRGSGPRARR